MKKPCLMGILLASLSFAVGAASLSPTKPDFSGTWVLNLERSRLQVDLKLESATFTIEHKDPGFRFSRVFVIDGKEDSLSYSLSTDGREKVMKEPGRTTTSRLYWDGKVLVLDERTVLGDGREATNVVRYNLIDGGRTLVAEEKFRGPLRKHDNLWVAERKS
jgi:hypothetical protein